MYIFFKFYNILYKHLDTFGMKVCRNSLVAQAIDVRISKESTEIIFNA